MLNRFLQIACFVACCCGVFAHAQSWPGPSVRIVVPAPAGSSVDVVARLLAEDLRTRWQTGVIIDNRPAAGGTVAAAEVARALPDGRTLYLGFNAPLATAPSLYRQLGYDPARDFVPVALTGSQPNLLVAHAGLPAKTLPALIALARREPGKLNYASVGNGSSSHLAMELFKREAGVDVVHVPFNGGPPATQALVAGEVQIMFAAPANLLGQVRSGKLVALAVTGRRRIAALPEVPTIAESGGPSLRDFEAVAWNGLVAPAGTPRALVLRINADVNQALQSATLRDKFAAAGIEPGGGSPEAFGQLIAAETRKWREVIRVTGARVD